MQLAALEIILAQYLEDQSSFEKLSFEINEENAKEWLLLNTKFIIQRSYRIIKFFHGKWNVKTERDCKDNLLRIFKEIFVNQAGLESNTEGLFDVI